MIKPFLLQKVRTSHCTSDYTLHRVSKIFSGFHWSSINVLFDKQLQTYTFVCLQISLLHTVDPKIFLAKYVSDATYLQSCGVCFLNDVSARKHEFFKFVINNIIRFINAKKAFKKLYMFYFETFRIILNPSSVIEKELRNFLRKYLKELAHLSLIHEPHTIGDHFKYKDKQAHLERCNVVYTNLMFVWSFLYWTNSKKIEISPGWRQSFKIETTKLPM